MPPRSHRSRPSRDVRSPQSKPPRRYRWILPLVIGALILAGGVAARSPWFAEQFPEETIASCTVEHFSAQSTRRASFRASLHSDCGSFRAPKQVACTTDPTTRVPLIAGTSYDLVVRGPRIPLVSVPRVVAATVSSEQSGKRVLEPSTIDPAAPEAVQQLQRDWLPETLRAFDYEQPAFDPSCDPSRRVMTSKGPQVVSPEQAEQLLTVPSGVTPRVPKLPCDGHGCPAAEQ